MAGVPKYQVLRREREMWSTQRERPLHWGPQSLVGNLVPRDRSELRPSKDFEEMRDRSSECEKHSPRKDLEGRLASGGWQLEACWGGRNSL
jgi:hypothetical protein